MKDLDKMLDKYAQLCVKVGINIKEGQPLVINAPIEGLEFVRKLAENAYELGASEVHVNWSDEKLIKTIKKYPIEAMIICDFLPVRNPGIFI